MPTWWSWVGTQLSIVLDCHSFACLWAVPAGLWFQGPSCLRVLVSRPETAALWELPARTSLQASCLSSCPLPPHSPEPWCFSLPGRVSASVAASLLLQPGGAGGADGLRGSLAVCSERSVDLLSSPCIENSLLKTWWAYFYGPLPTAESIVIRWDFLAILFHFRVILNQAWVNIYDFSRNVADLWHGN